MNAPENRNAIEEITEETAQTPEQSWGRLSMNYVLDKIEAVRKDTQYLHETISALNTMPASQGPEDIAGAEKAKALADVVRCRETTNQQLLRMYEKMYDDLKPRGTQESDMFSSRFKALCMAENLIESCEDMDTLPAVLESLQNFCDTMRFI